MALLEVKNLTKIYGTGENEVKALDHVSFSVEKGEFIAIVGSSGSGKSTLLHLIGGVDKPTSGEVIVNRINVYQQNEEQLAIFRRREVGLIYQFYDLIPVLTVEENMTLPVLLDNQKVNAIRLEELLKILDLTNRKNHLPKELSGGQQQRVGVARAFASEPDIILMDEPFSALDPITRSQLQDELLTLQANVQKTIVFVTHDMAEAIKLADRICIMNDGKIQQYDTPEQILKHPANDFVLNFVGKKRIWDSPELIKAHDIMIEEPIVCRHSLKCIKALNIMFNFRVDSLMVIDKDRHFMGVINASQAALEENKSKRVSDVMNQDCVTVSSLESIVDVLNIAKEKDMYTIPVVDDGILSGLITKSTLVTTLSQKYDESEGE